MAEATLQQVFQETADAIRSKRGFTAKLKPEQFGINIEGITEKAMGIGYVHIRESTIGTNIIFDSENKKLTVKIPADDYASSFRFPIDFVGAKTNSTNASESNVIYGVRIVGLLKSNAYDATINLGTGTFLTNGMGPGLYRSRVVDNDTITVESYEAQANHYFQSWTYTAKRMTTGESVFEIQFASTLPSNAVFNQFDVYIPMMCYKAGLTATDVNTRFTDDVKD